MTGSAGQRRVPAEFIEDFPIFMLGDNARRAAGKLLAEADAELTGMERTIAALRAQKRGLMQKLLSGEWRLDERFDSRPSASSATLVGGGA
jgi:type I restriction enzyme S subunit